MRNVTQDAFGRSLIGMVERAVDGVRLRVQGMCPGTVVVKADILIRGTRDGATLAGRNYRRVVRLKRSATETLRDLVIQRGSAESAPGS